ncbi:tetratricopeptide repeat protein [Cerasibacillus terrae]|uniref:Tetratricopeptide repeat protein n=1 Tax=Cerasibacillus terrae TaxID=2498845 RepID=A0A5C8NN96_9BACI|nr:DUF3196 family protein [Cerasibacillus terrae]TXL62560.1 tetratricopeptide repeat protein [Cerasibacillus terrae]
MANDNVILFPKWKTELKEESLKALEEKKYAEALIKFDELIKFKEVSHEIIMGKLICLLELGHYEEAEELCINSMIMEKGETYYHYVHIYLTILFQTNQYKELMEYVEEKLSNPSIPEASKLQFQQLYELSKSMDNSLKEKNSINYIKSFWKSVENEDIPKQWQLIQELRKTETTPKQDIGLLLQHEEIHPVVKTAIFQWLQEREINHQVLVSKLDEKRQLIPTQVPNIEQTPFIQDILKKINLVEQKNPTLHSMLKEMIYRYTYVKYPLLPDSDNIQQYATSFLALGKQYLHTYEEDVDEQVLSYMEEIKMCETLYLSIIEQ